MASHATTSTRPALCAEQSSPMRALAVPTLLLVVVAAMIAKVAFFEAAPAPVELLHPMAQAAAIEMTVAPTATAEATATRAALTAARAAEPPRCDTPAPGGICRTTLPICPAVLATPGVLCRWPRDPSMPPH